MRYEYEEVERLTRFIEEPNAAAVRRIVQEHRYVLRSAPGSRSAHQAWPGGYWDHVTDVMNLARSLYATMGGLRALPFSLSDALLVLFFHDIEKPFKYECEDPELRARLEDKEARKSFCLDMAMDYGVSLTEEHRNALRYVEGEGDDYVPGQRVMSPLAAFCHMCDVASARIWHDRPHADETEWGQRFTSNE